MSGDINADDYYGASAFVQIYDFLKNMPEDSDKQQYAMVGYKLGNTVTEKGSVARGVCEVEGGYLKDIVENTGIFTDGKRIYSKNADGTEKEYSADTTVSMNLWGLTPTYIEECYKRFPAFLDKGIQENPEKCEFYMPTVISELILEGKADIKVLSNRDKWYGVTYKEDKPKVVEAFKRLKMEGKYPENF